MLYNLLHLPERRSTSQLEWVPFVNVCLIIILVYALGNRLFLPPGVTIELPALPPQSLQGTLYNGVLTVINTDTILFDENVYHTNSIQVAFRKYLQGKNVSNPVLLIKCDQSCSIQQILTLCSQAREAGFAKVHLALRP